MFAECVRKLEPGGRIAVNVANLGRKPYRSLSADVIRILEHDLGLLLRGELIWQKGEGASGSCAWGSFRSACQPGAARHHRAGDRRQQGPLRPGAARSSSAPTDGLPHESTLMTDDFMALTLDVWSIPPESARRVGHPAPFPVELPEQLIRLYTFATTSCSIRSWAAVRHWSPRPELGRRYVGYDLDAGYVELARARVEDEGDPILYDAARVAGSKDLCADIVAKAGFTSDGTGVRLKGSGVTAHEVAVDRLGGRWVIELGGPFVR